MMCPADSAGAELDGPRPARPDELEAVLATANEVMRTSRGRPPSIATDWPHVYNPGNIENIVVVTSGRKVVSSVAIWVNEIEFSDARLKVGGINCLATLPEFRGRGLGSKIMQAAHQRMGELGCGVGLLGTEIIDWYRRLGWEKAGCARSYQLDRGNICLLPQLPGKTELRVAGEESLADVIRLRRADRLGGIREPEGFRQVLSARGNLSIVLALENDRALAYLLARDWSVIEWGGPAETVAGLIRAWFEKNADPSASTSKRDSSFKAVSRGQMTLATPCGGHSLIGILDNLMIPYNSIYVGMLYLLDPRGVLDAFGYKDVEISEDEGHFTLRRAEENVTLDRNKLTKLFFGPERVSSFAGDVFPFPFCQWPLDHV